MSKRRGWIAEGKQRVRKHVRELLKRNPGWKLVKTLGSGHLELSHPDLQRSITSPSTPSDHRSMRNLEAHLRRTLRHAKLPSADQLITGKLKGH